MGTFLKYILPAIITGFFGFAGAFMGDKYSNSTHVDYKNSSHFGDVKRDEIKNYNAGKIVSDIKGNYNETDDPDCFPGYQKILLSQDTILLVIKK